MLWIELVGGGLRLLLLLLLLVLSSRSLVRPTRYYPVLLPELVVKPILRSVELV